MANQGATKNTGPVLAVRQSERFFWQERRKEKKYLLLSLYE
jgi:hypothetical protein